MINTVTLLLGCPFVLTLDSPWQPPAGQSLPKKPYSLVVTRDGTLWIGAMAGLSSWSGGKLIQYPEIGDQGFAASPAFSEHKKEIGREVIA